MARSIRTRLRVRRGIDIVALGLFALLACARETQELLGRGGDGGLRRSLRLRARLRRQPLRERERRRLRLTPLLLLLGLRRGRARCLLAILNLGRRLLAHHLAALGLRRLSTSSLRSRRRLGRSRLGLGGRLGRECSWRVALDLDEEAHRARHLAKELADHGALHPLERDRIELAQHATYRYLQRARRASRLNILHTHGAVGRVDEGEAHRTVAEEEGDRHGRRRRRRADREHQRARRLAEQLAHLRLGQSARVGASDAQ